MVGGALPGDRLGEAMATRGIRKPQKALTARFVETVTETGKYFDGQGLFLRVHRSVAFLSRHATPVQAGPQEAWNDILQALRQRRFAR